MKKILQFATAVVLTFSAVESKGQVTNGNLSADWTLTDINGVSHNLYTYLNAGKTVFIDISATWCSPCWAYHNSGAFENLWINHGPTGGTGVSASTTNDCMVFFVEGDASTTTADLHGTGTNTQGDWTAGTNHPIIDPTSSTTPSTNAFNAIYNLSYFPTCVMICPDRSMTEVDQYTVAQLYAAKSACSAASTGIDAQMMLSTSLNAGLASCDSVTPKFRFGNLGTTTLTSATITYAVDGVNQKTINWTGSLATYENATVTGVKVGAPTPGNHTITATISNPNGGTDVTASNNSTTASFSIYPTVGGGAITESFEAAGIPSSWAVAGGSTTWASETSIGFNSSSSAYLNWYSISSGQIDYMSLPPMSFIGASAASLTFDVAHAQYASEADKLEVQISTNCGTTWASKYTKSGSTLATAAVTTSQFVPASASEWRHETVALTSALGQGSVLVRFKGTSAYGNDLYIDNVNFTITTGIEENEMLNNIAVYPNPMSDFATVTYNIAETNIVKIELVNAIGQVVMKNDLGKINAGQHDFSLNSSELINGLYFLNITVGNSTVTKKVSINK